MENTFDTEKGREFINKCLHEGICTVEFTKKNGDKRVLKCTLRMDTIPEEFVPTGESTRAKNNDARTVFDVENNQWRSFRWDAVESFTFDISGRT